MFAELLAVSSALPGPASTQLAYTVALIRDGIVPAIWAFCLWRYALVIHTMPPQVQSWHAASPLLISFIGATVTMLRSTLADLKLTYVHPAVYQVVFSWVYWGLS
jgi:hypothetical protein